MVLAMVAAAAPGVGVRVVALRAEGRGMGDSNVSDVLTAVLILPDHVKDGMGGRRVQGGDSLLSLDWGGDPGA